MRSPCAFIERVLCPLIPSCNPLSDRLLVQSIGELHYIFFSSATILERGEGGQRERARTSQERRTTIRLFAPEWALPRRGSGGAGLQSSASTPSTQQGKQDSAAPHEEEEEEEEEESKEKEGIGIARASPMVRPTIYIMGPRSTSIKEKPDSDSTYHLGTRARFK